MGTKEKGDLAESAVLHALIKSGYKVLIPYGENHRYDLVVDTGEKFVRIQVKTGTKKNGCLKFKTTSSTTKYDMSYRGQIEFFMVYLSETDKIYSFKVDDVPEGYAYFRIDAPKLHDPRIRYARDYEFKGELA